MDSSWLIDDCGWRVTARSGSRPASKRYPNPIQSRRATRKGACFSPEPGPPITPQAIYTARPRIVTPICGFFVIGKKPGSRRQTRNLKQNAAGANSSRSTFTNIRPGIATISFPELKAPVNLTSVYRRTWRNHSFRTYEFVWPSHSVINFRSSRLRILMRFMPCRGGVLLVPQERRFVVIRMRDPSAIHHSPS